MSKMTLNLNLSFWIVCSVATSKFADCETKTRSRKCENYLRLHHYQQHISHAHSHLTYCYKALNFCSNHQSCGCNTETTHPGLCFIFSTVPVASCPHRWSPLWFTKHSFFFFFLTVCTQPWRFCCSITTSCFHTSSSLATEGGQSLSTWLRARKT